MRSTFLVPVAATSLSLLLGACAGMPRPGCRPPEVDLPRLGCATETVDAGTAPVVSRVMPGDVLVGRLAGTDACESFDFDGVEYTILDLAMEVDCGGGPAPTLTVVDPEGRPVDLGACTSGDGRKLEAPGVVLRRTGTYRGTVCRAAGCGSEQHYRVSFDLRFPGQEDRRLDLTPASDEKLSFVASRGANCVVNLRPERACGVVPKVLMVKGPDGIRALAPEHRLEGAPAPAVTLERDTGRTLRFFAPRAGRYTVHVGAEEGTAGPVLAHVAVFPPRSASRTLFHGGPEAACLPSPQAPPCRDCLPPATTTAAR